MKPLVALAALSGLPPSPLFFAKLAIITQISGSPSIIPLFLVCRVPVVCSYFVFSFSKLIMHCQI
jgi:formate hydrogenlyase subunit 3/multisubunit Na+/H+ antiporter MnhD subunit